MKESFQFNVFHQFAGCFMPYGLLSIRRLRAGAKVCYASLAQQANARGVTQLNLPMLASSIGELEVNAVRYLIELEEAGLIESSRGNVNQEDVRISFPCHPWQAKYSESERARPASTLERLSNESQPQLFAVESSLAQTTGGQTATNKKSSPTSKSRRRKRWFGRPRSRHSLETCLRFITYQKEVLGRRGIYDPVGLAESIYHTGQQDEEVSDWVADQEANAA